MTYINICISKCSELDVICDGANDAVMLFIIKILTSMKHDIEEKVAIIGYCK